MIIRNIITFPIVIKTKPASGIFELFSAMKRTNMKRKTLNRSSSNAEVIMIFPVGVSSFPKSINILTPTGRAVRENTIPMNKELIMS